MAYEESLFERLRSASDAREQGLAVDRGRHVASIRRNLERILGARQGHAPAQMEIGIPAPTEVANLCGGGLSEMQRILRLCIQNYEPRLSDVQVMHIEAEDENSELVFGVRARLAALEDQPYVSFELTVDASGHLRLKN